MILSYTFFFVALLCLLFNVSIEEVQRNAVFDFFSKETYEAYVHCPRPHASAGFKMHALIPASSGSAVYRNIFKIVLDHTYHSADFHTDELAFQLLDMFENQLSLNLGPSQKEMIHYQTRDDLNLVIPPQELKNTYSKLMQGSESLNDGYPSLKDFFQFKDSSQSMNFNLYDVHTLIVEALFSKEVAQDLIRHRKEWEKLKNLNPSEENRLKEEFFNQHHLARQTDFKNCFNLIIR